MTLQTRLSTFILLLLINGVFVWPVSAQIPGTRVVLTADHDVFFLGENVLVHYCFENVSAPPVQISYGGDYRGGSRSLRFKLTATDENGMTIPDPDPSGYSSGGLGGSMPIRAGERWCQSIPLMRYARIDQPGSYEICVVHDLGLPAGDAPAGHLTLNLVQPMEAQAEAIVAVMQALPRNSGVTMGGLSRPYADFSALRYAVFLPSLLQRATAGDPVFAEAVGYIPVPEATRALLGLLNHPSAEVVRAAGRALATRLPDPELDGVLGARNPFDNELAEPRRYLIRTGWRPEFTLDVRAAASKLLKSDEPESVRLGAFMIEAVGGLDDAPILAESLTRSIEKTLTLPFEASRYPRPRGSAQELLRAADILVNRGYSPDRPGDTPGDLALWLVSIGHGARPAQWQEGMALALNYRIPYIRELALNRLPPEAAEGFSSAIRETLKSADPDVQIAACSLIDRGNLTALLPQVADAFRRTTDITMSTCGSTLYKFAGRFEGANILVSRLTESGMTSEVLRQLVSLLDSNGSSACCTVPVDQVQPLAARWEILLDSHRDAIEAGRKISLDDPDVTPDIIPSGAQLFRTGKPPWPAAR